jgi:hypothetical protein
MPVLGVSIPNSISLGRQDTLVETFFDKYTSTGVPAAATNPQYIITDGVNGGLYWEIYENNVAAGGSVIIEGSFDSVNWYALGFYPIVSAGTTQTAPGRTSGTQAIAQNSRYVWQVLDAYPYNRARVTANASSASLTAKIYGMAA